MICQLCPNLCGVDREKQLGLCLAKPTMIINRIAPHFYEEPPISGTKGSGAIFFGGCTMKCDFCQNYQISRAPHGKEYTPSQLADAIKRLEDMGVHNINFVSPTHYSDQIKRALDIYKPHIPILYNTSGYELVKIIDGLKGYIDIYLPDFKYSDNALCEKFSHRKNYCEIALSAIHAMRQQVTDTYAPDGVMQSGVIIRHLALPSYLQNSKDVIKIVANDFPTTTLSLMSQFTPIDGCLEPNRKLKPIEYKMVVNYAEKLGLTAVFVQENTSADKGYIPQFEI